MNARLKEAKAAIRSFMRYHYTDDRLAQLLDHARADKLIYDSCCCFIGIVTADHELQENVAGTHYTEAKRLAGARAAESGFWKLASSDLICGETDAVVDAVRRRLIIPIVKAEIRRRRTTQSLIESAALEESLAGL